jgi:hypothetical protein
VHLCVRGGLGVQSGGGVGEWEKRRGEGGRDAVRKGGRKRGRWKHSFLNPFFKGFALKHSGRFDNKQGPTHSPLVKGSSLRKAADVVAV